MRPGNCWTGGGWLNLGFIYCYYLLLLIMGPLLVSGSVHQYANEPFIAQSNSFFFHGGSEGLFASFDSSSPSLDNQKNYRGKSFIRFEDVIFERTKASSDKQNEMQSKTGLVEAIIVEVNDRGRVGGAFLKCNAICCTPEFAHNGSCNLGEVIIHSNLDNPQWPNRIQTFFEGKNQQAKMAPQTVDIKGTGMYYLYFMFCDPQLEGTIISGRTVWKNPEGYLPGKMVHLMTFHGTMSLAYLVLGLLWFLKFVKYWKDIIHLHYHITAVIALGMCETALWYFEYSNLNATGSRPMLITLWAVTVTAVKKTVSRLLLLVVSMGYGVVKPTLGGVTSKVLLLGMIYFVASVALELVEHLGNINDFSGKAKIYLVLPVAFLDAWFILWIFSSLSTTLEKLQMRRSMAKLELYRKFTNFLAIFVLLSIAWIGYELYFNASDPLNELWRIAWIIPSFWTLLAFSLLGVICVLWAPSDNPTRYAYAGDDVDEEAISLTGGVKAAVVPNELGVIIREDVEEDKRE